MAAFRIIVITALVVCSSFSDAQSGHQSVAQLATSLLTLSDDMFEQSTTSGIDIGALPSDVITLSQAAGLLLDSLPDPESDLTQHLFTLMQRADELLGVPDSDMTGMTNAFDMLIVSLEAVKDGLEDLISQGEGGDTSVSRKKRRVSTTGTGTGTACLCGCLFGRCLCGCLTVSVTVSVN
ncbi:uncharacterized protein [Littorina saxatilis]|uniref:Uncharacterized protein n=1 Tax=Littorina saxatilis TaxID=31220 RepID=A0AAN9AIZ5_9CAEN